MSKKEQTKIRKTPHLKTFLASVAIAFSALSVQAQAVVQTSRNAFSFRGKLMQFNAVQSVKLKIAQKKEEEIKKQISDLSKVKGRPVTEAEKIRIGESVEGKYLQNKYGGYNVSVAVDNKIFKNGAYEYARYSAFDDATTSQEIIDVIANPQSMPDSSIEHIVKIFDYEAERMSFLEKEYGFMLQKNSSLIQAIQEITPNRSSLVNFLKNQGLQIYDVQPYSILDNSGYSSVDESKGEIGAHFTEKVNKNSEKVFIIPTPLATGVDKNGNTVVIFAAIKPDCFNAILVGGVAPGENFSPSNPKPNIGEGGKKPPCEEASENTCPKTLTLYAELNTGEDCGVDVLNQQESVEVALTVRSNGKLEKMIIGGKVNFEKNEIILKSLNLQYGDEVTINSVNFPSNQNIKLESIVGHPLGESFTLKEDEEEHIFLCEGTPPSPRISVGLRGSVGSGKTVNISEVLTPLYFNIQTSQGSATTILTTTELPAGYTLAVNGVNVVNNNAIQFATGTTPLDYILRDANGNVVKTGTLSNEIPTTSIQYGVDVKKTQEITPFLASSLALPLLYQTPGGFRMQAGPQYTVIRETRDLMEYKGIGVNAGVGLAFGQDKNIAFDIIGSIVPVKNSASHRAMFSSFGGELSLKPFGGRIEVGVGAGVQNLSSKPSAQFSTKIAVDLNDHNTSMKAKKKNR